MMYFCKVQQVQLPFLLPPPPSLRQQNAPSSSSSSFSLDYSSWRWRGWRLLWWSTSFYRVLNNHHAVQLVNWHLIYMCESLCENLVTIWQELWDMSVSPPSSLPEYSSRRTSYARLVLKCITYPYRGIKWVISNIKLIMCSFLTVS